MDIAPTILYLLGIPIPSYLDGRVLTEAFKEDYCNKFPIEIKEEEGYLPEAADAGENSQEELEEEIRKELQKMGYIKR